MASILGNAPDGHGHWIIAVCNRWGGFWVVVGEAGVTCVLAFSQEGARMPITRRDWWAGIAMLTAALLLNSVGDVQRVLWTYWATGVAIPPL
jgi:hypothetical protein